MEVDAQLKAIHNTWRRTQRKRQEKVAPVERRKILAETSQDRPPCCEVEHARLKLVQGQQKAQGERGGQ